MSLGARLKAEIASAGPLTVAQFMTRCLHDPQDGYYALRPALGGDGDFITAPLVSQMFGEMLGLWAVETWRRLGSPRQFLLVEAGPGDGTLIGDVLRAARVAPEFLQAADLWLLETSAPLRAAQANRLRDAPLEPRWGASLEDLPAGVPVLLIANELLDCLPARQFVRIADGWAERVVGLGPEGELAFGLSRAPVDLALPWAPAGSVVETSPAQEAFGAALGGRIAADGGAALLVDYGRDRPEPGDTLQALSRHRKVPPLDAPGEADLTVHVDFPAVAAAARAAGAQARAILTQGDFLTGLGIVQRAEALAARHPEHFETLERQLARLIAPDQMGTLFKVLAVYAGPAPPGFEED